MAVVDRVFQGSALSDADVALEVVTELDFACSAVCVLSAAASVEDTSVPFAVAIPTVLAATVAAQLANVNFAGTVATVLAATATFEKSPGMAVSSAGVLAASASVELQRLMAGSVAITSEARLAIGNECAIRGSVRLSLCARAALLFPEEDETTARCPTTLRGVMDSLFLLWGIERASNVPEYLIAEAALIVNAAMQAIYAEGRNLEHVSRRVETIALAAGTSSFLLSDEIAGIWGNVRHSGTGIALCQCRHRQDFEQFGILHLGDLTDDDPTGVPAAFYLEKEHRRGRAEGMRLTLKVVPSPSEATVLLADVTVEAPHYCRGDYPSNRTLPLPNRYIEGLLLPICRMRAAESYYFTKPDRLPAIESSYREAMAMLGQTEPDSATDKREGAAARQLAGAR